MRSLSILFVFVSFCSFGQHELHSWVEVGVEKKLNKRLKSSLALNTRFDDQGVRSFFPQLGVEYKIKKWVKPSLEYRMLIDRNKYGNYKLSHRLNGNLAFKGDVKRVSLGLRIRYQYSFNRVSQASYDADFDQAVRFKPSFEYDIKKSIINPTVSTEFFLNPSYGPNSPGFSKIRYAIGLKLDKKGPHNVAIKYRIDQKLDEPEDDLRHIVSVSYGYSF